MFRLVEFLFYFRNLLGFHVRGQNAAPFFERLFPLRGRQIRPSRFRVDITEVRMNRRVVPLALDRFAQRRLRFGIFLF